MTFPPPGGSRDRRIEDPTNLWIVHPAGRLALPWFVARGISANAVSIGGLILGIGAAIAYDHWTAWPFALLGLILCIGWLIADGLDGMIARATGTASPLGRFLDGVCDHGVFILIYVVIATSIGTSYGWALALSAGALHALQSNIYEGERARFHRRSRGVPAAEIAPAGNLLQQGYDYLTAIADQASRRFDEALRRSPDPQRLGTAYADAAVGPMRLMSLLSANVRVYAIFIACVAGDPRLFWWFEIVPLTVILIIGFAWHRSVETRLARPLVAGRTHPLYSNQLSTEDVPKQ